MFSAQPLRKSRSTSSVAKRSAIRSSRHTQSSFSRTGESPSSVPLSARSLLMLCLAILFVVGLGIIFEEQAGLSILAAMAAPLPEGREALPPGVTVQSLLPDMRNPVAMAFDPQGRLFYTEKTTGEV